MLKSKFWKKYYLTCYTLAKKKKNLGLDFIQEDICLLKLIIAQPEWCAKQVIWIEMLGFERWSLVAQQNNQGFMFPRVPCGVSQGKLVRHGSRCTLLKSKHPLSALYLTSQDWLHLKNGWMLVANHYLNCGSRYGDCPLFQ